ncbi:MAG: glycosyltransferase family 9 protein [Desulfobacterota bacterium]|nr:glycosyltransferase family 9 protein [Thermodesulfobacteriota bacterium]
MDRIKHVRVSLCPEGFVFIVEQWYTGSKMDILFIKLGAMGDVINTLPLAIALKGRLDARIHWLVEPLSMPILAGHPAIEEVILFDKRTWSSVMPDVLRRLRARRFDMALDLQRIIKSGLFCLSSRSDRRIGFDRARCKEFTWVLPFERIPAGLPGAHMAHQYLEFARYLGAAPGEIRWDIPVSGTIPSGLPGEYVVLNVGATKAANRWTAEGFAALAASLKERRSLVSVLTGGPEDVAMARRIRSLGQGSIIDLVGKTTIPELKEIIAGSLAVVSCDTGPMHLAVALGREVVALMGPSDPTRTGPLRGRVVRLDLASGRDLNS